MIQFFENHSLKAYNTFGVEARTRYFFEFTESEDLEIFLRSNKTWQDEPLIVLGEGSNILFVKDFIGLIIRPKVPGIEGVYEDRNNQWIEVGAGETWDDFVHFAVRYGLGGIENLSLIPGTVGAAPVQNIGAYGQEVCNVVEKVKGFDLETMQMKEYTAKECAFAYRDSIFKNYLKNKFIITSVIFRLEKFPEYNLKYGMLKEKVKEKGETNLDTIRRSVIEIRRSKLPEVKELGNAGSFFKNPVVKKDLAENLLKQHPDMPIYPVQDEKVKLAAGWLIEQAGWKGFRDGDAGVHVKQALVLVNYGNASGKDILGLSEKIKQSVMATFNVELECEVNCL
jgi:UDP-N-acetylmuramate dehydrogenase